jgi:hypothetical protein
MICRSYLTAQITSQTQPDLLSHLVTPAAGAAAAAVGVT